MLIEKTCYYDDFMHDIDADWTIAFDDLNDIPFDLNADEKIVTLHNFGLKTPNLLASPYFKPQVMLALIDALRMVRHVEWLDGTLHRYHPETILLIGRICVADTQSQKIATAWDVKMSGDDTLWKHVLCGDVSDMTIAFVNGLENFLAGGMDENMAMKKSMAIAFNKWFSCPVRTKDCDHDTLNLIDDLIADNVILGVKKLEKNAVTCLTLMAGKTDGYIDRHLQNDILKNPYYTSMNDEINQAHLMQTIKDMNTTTVAGLVFQDKALAQRFMLCE